jgi:hypothetical protein
MMNKLISLMIGLLMSTALLAQNIPGALSVPGNLLFDDPKVMKSLSPACPGCIPYSMPTMSDPGILSNGPFIGPFNYPNPDKIITWVDRDEEGRPIALVKILVGAQSAGECIESVVPHPPGCVASIPCAFEIIGCANYLGNNPNRSGSLEIFVNGERVANEMSGQDWPGILTEVVETKVKCNQGTTVVIVFKIYDTFDGSVLYTFSHTLLQICGSCFSMEEEEG